MQGEKRWDIAPKIESTELLNFPELPEVIVQLLTDRGMTDRNEIDNFLNPDYADLLDPFLIKDMRKAVERIFKAVSGKEKILIFGDYDADGVSGSTIMYQAITKVHQTLNATATAGIVGSVNDVPEEELDVFIPDRSKEGYGLNDESIQYVLKSNPGLVITIDCGVTSKLQIKALQDQGIDVIVIDHHSVPPEMPPAYALIIPKRTGDSYPFKDLCGAGLSFKTATALIKELRFRGYNHLVPEGFEKWFLDFAAIGTIGDMVPLVGENRVIVKYGLYVLAKTKNIGLKSLIQAAGITPEVVEESRDGKNETQISVYSVGFQIAPRINSAGRIAHANHAIKLFQEKSQAKAEELANTLNALNDERKQMTEDVFQAVEDRLLAHPQSLEQTRIIFEGDENWPAGVLGIVASRLMDKYYRPVILYQKKPHINVSSGRSIKGFDLAKAIHEMRPILEAGGGHAQAAGMSFRDENIAEIKRRLQEKAERDLTLDMLVPRIRVDALMKASEVDWQTYDLIGKLAPYGMGNPTPVFLIENMTIQSLRTVGKEKTHLQVTFQSEEQLGLPVTFKGIGFSLAYLAKDLFENDVVDVVFQLDVNEWGDKRELQMKVLDMKRHV